MTKREGDASPSQIVPPLSGEIRAAIRDSGVSVYRIAKEAGVDQSTLNKFLNGTRRNIRLDVADRLFPWFFHPPRRKARPFK